MLVEASDAVEDDDIVGEKSSIARPTAFTSSIEPVLGEETVSKMPADEYEDMEDESLALDDVSTVNGSSSSTAADNTVRARRYDVTITYDNYYRVPRIWLFGFNENGSGLSTHEVYQDVMQDYANKTVTIDPHPHLSNTHASILPCQHAPAMLNILTALKEVTYAYTVYQQCISSVLTLYINYIYTICTIYTIHTQHIHLIHYIYTILTTPAISSSHPYLTSHTS